MFFVISMGTKKKSFTFYNSCKKIYVFRLKAENRVCYTAINHKRTWLKLSKNIKNYYYNRRKVCGAGAKACDCDVTGSISTRGNELYNNIFLLVFSFLRSGTKVKSATLNFITQHATPGIFGGK